MKKIKAAKKINKYSYQEDEEFRRRWKKRMREKYHKDPAYKKAALKRAKNKYHSDADYRTAAINRAKERYRRLKEKKLIESRLIQYFQRNGYFRIPDEELRERRGEDYKKGYEIRFVANDERELSKINSHLRKAGFKRGKSFEKNNKFVLPVYGREAVEKFRKILSAHKIRRKKKSK